MLNIFFGNMKIRVRYERGVLKPLNSDINLEEGKEYTVVIENLYDYILEYYGKVKGKYQYRDEELEEAIYGKNIH